MIRTGEMWRGGTLLGTSVLVKVFGVWMTVGTAIAFLRMAAAAFSDGVTFTVNSGWRSNEEQAQLYALFTSGQRAAVVAPPGHSNHQAGDALDIESGNGSNAAFAWLNANGAKYGFRRTVASEPWHWEYRA
jgi:LAS superfamily LD-carboxypeptidase LdcB